MAEVTIQYWAAARAAAGVTTESVEAATLAEALEVIVARRGDDGRLRSVLDTCSFLVDGAPASRQAASGLVLRDAAHVEVLPQFAGGLPPGREARGPRGSGGRGGLGGKASPQDRGIPGVAPRDHRVAHRADNTLECPYQYVPTS